MDHKFTPSVSWIFRGNWPPSCVWIVCRPSTVSLCQSRHFQSSSLLSSFKPSTTLERGRTWIVSPGIFLASLATQDPVPPGFLPLGSGLLSLQVEGDPDWPVNHYHPPRPQQNLASQQFLCPRLRLLPLECHRKPHFVFWKVESKTPYHPAASSD